MGHTCHCVEDLSNSTFSEESVPMVTENVMVNTTEYVQPEMWDTFNRSVLIAKDCITIEDK